VVFYNGDGVRVVELTRDYRMQNCECLKEKHMGGSWR